MPSSLVFTPPAPDVLAAIAALETQDAVVLTLPWRALAITGPDAQTFLQGQFTTDMREVTPTQSRLGCLLNLKGRVQISGRLLAWPDGYVLLLPAAQFEPARARLGKYGVFSKISLSELPLRIQGVIGTIAAHDAADADTCTGDSLPLRVRLPGLARALWLSSAQDEPSMADTAAAGSIEAEAALQYWASAAIAAGEWTLDLAESELFQPQEMDYHALQGISYQKGCYLGQEIVARLYFRGQLKTELSAWLTATDCPSIQAGDALLDSEGLRVGEVIRAACLGTGQALLLAQTKRESEACSLQSDTGLVSLARQPFQR
ncbi:MAG: hypothetical protein AABY68_01170 [Pseudomonadota bacterium]